MCVGVGWRGGGGAWALSSEYKTDQAQLLILHFTVAKLRFWDCPCKHENISDIRTVIYKQNTS